MDTTDPTITFDAQGVCSHCHRAEELLAAVRFEEAESQRRLEGITRRIKDRANGREYDSIIGLSGGVDSSYTAYVAHKLGLRPLAVHFDNGWNSEIAVSNIKNIVKHLGFDLVTYVINWEEFRDIQRAFFRASVVDIEMITDHAIMAVMFGLARKHHIHFILSGSNNATEHCMPKAWIWSKQDLRNLKAIHARFGELPLKTFPTLSTLKHLVWRRMFFEYVPLLNNLNYHKLEAMGIMQQEIGWRDYGGKHFESVFTKFYQAYILPVKFNIDKRKPHLSALIRNDEINREEALAQLELGPYDPAELARDKEFVIKKLGFSESEFDAMMREKPVPHSAYPSDRGRVRRLMGLYLRLNAMGLVSRRH